MALAPKLGTLPLASGSTGAPSSAGWKMNFTVPGSWAFMPASTSAAPISMAVWASWPQACITGTSLPK
ncbi:hypothetical protein D3C72_2540390 [compost metagenome]